MIMMIRHGFCNGRKTWLELGGGCGNGVLVAAKREREREMGAVVLC